LIAPNKKGLRKRPWVLKLNWCYNAAMELSNKILHLASDGLYETNENGLQKIDYNFYFTHANPMTGADTGVRIKGMDGLNITLEGQYKNAFLHRE
jgi:hypothetical protein